MVADTLSFVVYCIDKIFCFCKIQMMFIQKYRKIDIFQFHNLMIFFSQTRVRQCVKFVLSTDLILRQSVRNHRDPAFKS